MTASDLIHALAIQRGDLVSLVGGGGKSTLLMALERAWGQGIILTTTTRIQAAQAQSARACLRLDEQDRLGDTLAAWGSCLIIGEISGDKALGVPPTWPGRWLARPDVAVVVAEADGARMLPVKAPAEHEPALPSDSTLVIVMAGLDALAGPIRQVAHRPNLVCSLTGLPADANLTPSSLATLLAHPQGGLKGVPTGARVLVCLNKADSARDAQLAEQTAARLSACSRIERVVVTSLQPLPQVIAVHQFAASGYC